MNFKDFFVFDFTKFFPKLFFSYFSGTPHVWLDIKDCPIDNTHVALPEGSEMHLEYFYKAKKANYYLKADPLTTTLNLYLGSEESTLTTRHNLKVFRNYVTNDPKVLNIALCSRNFHNVNLRLDFVEI